MDRKKTMAFLVVLLFVTSIPAIARSFPKKPIKLVVYTKPGGAIDIFARKFVKVASKYHDGKILVVNKPGAGGMIALKKISRTKADGYTIGAITKSVVGKMVTTKSKIALNDISWLSLMVSDPEAVIVNRNSEITNWQQLITHARKNQGKQLWVGPSPGGNDHILALKLWDKLGILARWVPYSGGGKAMAALMGKHGHAYVGNPGDVIGKPSLKVIAVSAQNRLAGAFADVPTFKELGIDNFDQEIMWRGLIAPKNLKKEAANFYKKLITNVLVDKEWQEYINKSGALPVNIQGQEFMAIAQKDLNEFTSVGKNLGIVK